jgi:predicted metal-binding protein
MTIANGLYRQNLHNPTSIHTSLVRWFLNMVYFTPLSNVIPEVLENRWVTPAVKPTICYLMVSPLFSYCLLFCCFIGYYFCIKVINLLQVDISRYVHLSSRFSCCNTPETLFSNQKWTGIFSATEHFCHFYSTSFHRPHNCSYRFQYLAKFFQIIQILFGV